ncbi:hypothetical protein X777_14475 [Ooceraea biroi]|uniref:Uncharacterized protein n=1 Tax=Ooceraea biroi TaxID=2015173 RepID=A0A026VYS7_OOCBI|nr:hypothetical protein X777_14475 [Ooceraea biroi]
MTTIKQLKENAKEHWIEIISHHYLNVLNMEKDFVYRNVKEKNSDTDTDTESKSSEEELSSINFPTYRADNADKTVFLSNLAHKDSANKAHINKSNNNVNQLSENKQQNSDNILIEIHTNFQKHANEMKEFQRQVLRHLHSINGRMGELNELVESLKQSNFTIDQDNANQNITNEVSLQCIESLPVKSNIELQNIERILQDKQIFHDVAMELSKIGGNNLKIIVKKVMCRILTPEIGREYSWEGHKGNLIFKDLILAKLVLSK